MTGRPHHRQPNGSGYVRAQTLVSGQVRYQARLRNAYLGSFDTHSEAKAAVEEARKQHPIAPVHTAPCAPVKERPILFSAPMVRALLNGSKTQTRRVVQVPAGWTRLVDDDRVFLSQARPGGFAAYRELRRIAEPGDQLWVRETFALPHGEQVREDVVYRADDTTDGRDERATRKLVGRADVPWRPAIFMPRWASRITLSVTGVRVERLQDIDVGDALCEGVEPPCILDNFRRLWDAINGKRPGCAWSDNPWVWVLSFRRHSP